MASNDFSEANNMQRQDASTYKTINQSHQPYCKKHWSVYGESHYLATGVHSKGAWDPTPLKGISSYPPGTDFTLQDILNEYANIVPWISNTPVDKRNPEHVKLLLHTVFPHLETKIAKSGRTADILDIMLTLSCVKQCPVVTRYALQLVLEALTNTSYDTGGVFNDFLLKCESCLRDFVLDASIFDFESVEDQGLRIFVYSRCLMILYANVVQGTIPIASIRDDFEDVHLRLCDLEKHMFFKEKDQPCYAINCIKETIARFSQVKMGLKESRKSFYAFLKWLRKYNSEEEENKDERTESIKNFLSKIKTSKKGWFDFHAALFCLGSQIHTKPKNREVLRTLVENYIKQHFGCRIKWTSEREWQTGLVLGSVLEDIVNYNHDRVTRTVACLCLIYCFNKLTKRKSAAKTWLQESLQRCLYGPNRDLREVILKHLEMDGEREGRDEDVINDAMEDRLPFTQSIKYLVQRYKKQILPTSINAKKMNNLKGYFSATFRGEKASVKILSSSKGDFVREDRTGQSNIQQQLVIEAYTLRRLNAKPHPNILKVLAYDTAAQPYHLITELVSEGSLLQFLHSLRSRPEHMPVPSVLLEMMFGIMDAVIHLDEQHLVHLALMAANVLVSHDNVCKLSGFQFVRKMTTQGGSRTLAYVSGDDDMALRHAAPESLENGCFSEKSVSWAIGIMLFEMHTYGVSPYNQYSNDQADQIRSHVIGRGELKMEDCIRSEVCEFIEMCLTYEKENRPSVEELRSELKRIRNQIIEEEEDWPPAIYPALTNVDLAQTKNVMISSTALEEIDKAKNLGNFGSQETSIDRPTIRIFDEKRVIREIINKEEADLDKLKYLKHENVVKVISLSDHDKKHVALVTECSGHENLLQTALAKHCSPEQLVTFAAQIAQGLHYLHNNNMIHGDLRAEHIMVFPNNKVKVSRLGRSKPLDNLHTKRSMPVDALRWSPSEVIRYNIYSRASDVYSYGLMCYELFDALDAAEGSTPHDVKPFTTIKDNQILVQLQSNPRPDKPTSMPIWLNIIIKQCLLIIPAERPVFAVIEDALTFRKPFRSYLLSQWIISREPGIVDVDVTQSEEATHVTPDEQHKTSEELCKIAYDEIKEDAYEEIPALKPRPLPCKPVQESSKLAPSPSVNTIQNIETNKSPPDRETSSVPHNRNQNYYENFMSSSSSGVYSKIEQDVLYAVPSPTTSLNEQNVEEGDLGAVRGEPVELSLQFSTQYVGNEEHEYQSINSDDLDATENSWSSLPLQNNQQEGRSSSDPTLDSVIPQNGQQDNGSLSGGPEYQENISMASNVLEATERSSQFLAQNLENEEREYMSVNSDDGATESSWISLPPQNNHQEWSSLPKPTYASDSKTTTSKLAGNGNIQTRSRPVPLPRTKLGWEPYQGQ